MKRTTIRDVAQEAGVSVASVSLFLNNKPGIGTDTRDSIARAIEKLGYVSRGRSQPATSRMIGLLMESLPFPVFSSSLYLQVLQGFESVARESDYHTVIVSIDTQDRLVVPKAVAECQYNGLVALGGGDLTDDFLESIVCSGVPMVLVDNYSLNRPMHSVVADYELGSYLAVKHLIERGHRRISIITGAAKYKPLTDRLLGYLRAMIESGHYPEPELICLPISKGFPNKGYREMKALLDLPERPTAVFCVSDRTALNALQAINEAGLRVPEDIALVGFDDVPEAQQTIPPLTTVHDPKWEMGAVAAQLLIDLINGKTSAFPPIRLVLPASLIVRASS
jgi:DNA-binding LacI/PurR family transcriptional regulator